MTVYGDITAGATVKVRTEEKAKASTLAIRLANENPGFRFRFVACCHIPLVGWEYKFAVKGGAQ